MNPEDQALQKFENDLSKLVPAEPGEALTARIFAAFETPIDAAPAEVRSNFITLPEPESNTWAQPFAAAAAVALIAGIIALIGLNRPEKPAGEPTAKFVPAGTQNTYQGTDVDGIIFTEDRRPLQAVRHQFIDTYTWENPEDGSRVELQVPVERIRYIPVQTD